MEVFFIYIIWIFINILEMIIFYKYAYYWDDTKMVMPRYMYLLWIIASFIPILNIIISIFAPINYFFIEENTLNLHIGLMKKCKIDKLMIFLTKKV